MASYLLDGYKVVRKSHEIGNFYSALSLGRIREYVLGKETNRIDGDGPLGVFTNFEDADVFFDDKHSWQILEVKYQKSKDKTFWYMVGDYKAKNEFAVPNGTDFADMVIPKSIVRMNGIYCNPPQVGYKLVKNVGRKYFSYVIDQEYHIGIWKERFVGWGPLALFDTLDHAIEFFENDTGNHYAFTPAFFKVEYYPSFDTRLWKPYLGIDSFYSPGAKGTILADKIKLLEEIPYEEIPYENSK